MYTVVASRGTRVLARDDDDSGGKLSTTTIIVIVVVCSCVGLLILALFLWRLIVRTCRRSQPTPLPPVQELAHRREQQLAVFAEYQGVNKPNTWLDDSRGSRHSHLYHASSALSLLPSTLEHNDSAHTDEGTTAESSSPSPDEPPLHPPNPAFFGTSWDPSSSPHNSFISTTTTASSVAPSASPSPAPSAPLSNMLSNSPIAAADSAQFPVPTASHGTYPGARVSRSSSRPQAEVLNRRLSQMSSATTTRRSIASHNSSVICGPPHGRHSNIQIVLPAPLGPHPLNTDGSVDDHGDRRSVRTSGFADQWVNAGSRSSSVDSRDRRRPADGDRRASSQPPAHNKLHRKSSADVTSTRTKSTSLRASQSYAAQPRTHAYQPPPVPRILEGSPYTDTVQAMSAPPRVQSPRLRPVYSAPAMQPYTEEPPQRQLANLFDATGLQPPSPQAQPPPAPYPAANAATVYQRPVH